MLPKVAPEDAECAPSCPKGAQSGPKGTPKAPKSDQKVPPRGIRNFTRYQNRIKDAYGRTNVQKTCIFTTPNAPRMKSRKDVDTRKRSKRSSRLHGSTIQETYGLANVKKTCIFTTPNGMGKDPPAFPPAEFFTLPSPNPSLSFGHSLRESMPLQRPSPVSASRHPLASDPAQFRAPPPPDLLPFFCRSNATTTSNASKALPVIRRPLFRGCHQAAKDHSPVKQSNSHHFQSAYQSVLTVLLSSCQTVVRLIVQPKNNESTLHLE
jgi:hypothetical protein